MRKLARFYRRFRAMPGVVQFGLVLALLLLALPAVAGDLVLKNKDTGSELRLMDSACTHGETLGHLKEEFRGQFKNARILDKRGFILFYGCWIDHDGETAFVMLQDGGSLGLPLAGFTDPML
jgi:hypothetical protein